MEKVLGQCHAEEKCHLSQNAMGKAKEDQMAPIKASLSVNKYADSFLLYVRDFSGAANKAYADMARRTLRIKEGPKGRIKLKKNATKVLRQAVESLKIDSSDSGNGMRNPVTPSLPATAVSSAMVRRRSG